MNPGFVSQSAWAARLGISVRTFGRWREAGLIPVPADLPGHPRWSVKVVETTERELRGGRRGFKQRAQQSRASRLHQSDRPNQVAGVSSQSFCSHAERMPQGETGTPLNCLAERE